MNDGTDQQRGTSSVGHEMISQAQAEALNNHQQLLPEKYDDATRDWRTTQQHATPHFNHRPRPTAFPLLT